jgi:hypothetical protein
MGSYRAPEAPVEAMLILLVVMSEDETFDPHRVGITFVPENVLVGLDEKDKRDISSPILGTNILIFVAKFVEQHTSLQPPPKGCCSRALSPPAFLTPNLFCCLNKVSSRSSWRNRI